MNANQILDMIVKTVVRRLVGTGVKAGMDVASGKMRQRGRGHQDRYLADEQESDIRPSPMQPGNAPREERMQQHGSAQHTSRCRRSIRRNSGSRSRHCKSATT